MDEQKQVVEYNVTDAQVAILAEQYKGMTITDGKSEKAVRAARKDVVGLRVNVEKRRVELKADALSYGRAVDSEAKRIKGLLEPIETELDATIKVVEGEREAVRAEKEQIEQERIDTIKTKISSFLEMAEVRGFSSANIQAQIDRVEEIDITEAEYQEFYKEALETGSAVLVELSKALAAQDAVELADAERKAEGERLEKVRLEQEEAQKAIDAEKLRLQEEEERIEAKKKASEDQLAAERIEIDDKVKAEEDRVEREALEKRLKEEAEKEAADKVVQDQKDKEAREEAEAAEKERLAELAPDKEKLRGYADSLGMVTAYSLNLTSEEARNVFKDTVESIMRTEKNFRKRIEEL